jgi:hypothetical protein
MARLLVAVLVLAGLSPAVAEGLRQPLEKQFFEYFQDRCQSGMSSEVEAAGKDPQDSAISEAVDRYCACTAQAIVSYLSAEEIIAFANNPEKEPAAAKMKPYFSGCQGKGSGTSL